MNESTYLVFLRGVMPTGKNRVPMADLRQILSDNGFKDVRTWIQSGNVILKTSLSPADLAQRVHDLIKTGIGADIKVIVKSTADVKAILEENPFQTGFDISRVFFSLFNDIAEDELLQNLLNHDFSPEKLIITNQAVYMYIPERYGSGKLSNNFLEKKLKISITTRNFNTLAKMVELGREKW